MGKLTYQTLCENVVDVIRMKIFNHELAPGMRIIEQDISDELGVSRGPIREALRQLEQEGLITRIPDQEDKRLVHLYVTPRGEELAQESIAIQREITCLAASTLTQEECICVENKLNEVLEHLSSLMEKNR